MVANDGDGDHKGAPLISEDHPTLANLVGRVEHIAQFGALITDFTMIRPGALHRANGGYLIIDARKILSEVFSWEALKRALRGGTITIVSAAEQLSLASTISLEPEPIPLKVKVVLVGERILYYLLSTLDPDFSELFKVEVDFDEELPTNSLEAWLLHAQGKAEFFKFTREGLIKSRELREAARRADPNWARPLAGLALVDWYEARRGMERLARRLNPIGYRVGRARHPDGSKRAARLSSARKFVVFDRSTQARD